MQEIGSFHLQTLYAVDEGRELPSPLGNGKIQVRAERSQVLKQTLASLKPGSVVGLPTHPHFHYLEDFQDMVKPFLLDYYEEIMITSYRRGLEVAYLGDPKLIKQTTAIAEAAAARQKSKHKAGEPLYLDHQTQIDMAHLQVLWGVEKIRRYAQKIVQARPDLVIMNYDDADYLFQSPQLQHQAGLTIEEYLLDRFDENPCRVRATSSPHIWVGTAHNVPYATPDPHIVLERNTAYQHWTMMHQSLPMEDQNRKTIEGRSQES